jgi:hypothetical protein
MKKLIAVFTLVLVFAGAWYFAKKPQVNTKPASPVREERVWQIKSVDTMKYSRDLSGQALGDSTFDTTIDTQVKAIAQTGANTVAVATPYDEKFVPVLSRWVAAARRYNMHVWFRGNFSAWEGWFGQDASLSRDDHLKMMRSFIDSNVNLFRDGDMFSPCPECENGGPGDPRKGDADGFRKFMTDEKQACDGGFKKIGKNVNCGLWPMNYDVAKLVVDPQTAKAMGGVVVIDHYVDTPQKLTSDIGNLEKQTGAKIFLGEVGVPIPDINGKMTDKEQADWLEAALLGISKDPQVIGLNYWTSFGGSTAIFSDDGSSKPAAGILTKYFKLTALSN